MTSIKPRYFSTAIEDYYATYFGIEDRKTKEQIACTIYWCDSPEQQIDAKLDAGLIVAALNAYQLGTKATPRRRKSHYIYGPDKEGVNDLFVVQDSTTGKDLACTIHWGEGEEVKAEQNIVLITNALNAYQPAKKRRV